MTFWRLFYHLTWATKGREPLIDPATERVVATSIRTACRDAQVILHALGMMPDHVHVVLSIPPRLAVAAVAKRLKGASSHAVNHGMPDRLATFAWQAEYGVLSFGEKNLPDVAAYVRDQRARHADQRLWPTLEQWSTTGVEAEADRS